MARISIIYAILQMWLLRSLVQGQTAVLDGTNYVSGSGFCFGDQQLKKETTFISCTSSGFTGNVTSYVVFWAINGISDLTVEQVERMYPNQLDAMTAPQQNEYQLNILNVTSLGVSSVACRISAFNGAVPLGVTPLSTVESISVVNTVPAPEMPRVAPSYTSAEVTVSKPSGLCEGLRSGQITYEFKVYRSNSLVTTENVTTSGPNEAATLSGLSISTEYTVEIRGIIDVVSQSMPVSLTFSTLPDVDECSSNTTNNCSHFCNNTIGGYICSCPNGYILASENFTCKREELPTTSPLPAPYISLIGAAVGGTASGIALIIIVVCLVLICIFCLKSRNSSPKDDQKKKSSFLKKGERSKATAGRDVIYDDPSEADAVQMQPSPAYAAPLAVGQSDLDTSYVKIEPSPAYQDWY